MQPRYYRPSGQVPLHRAAKPTRRRRWPFFVLILAATFVALHGWSHHNQATAATKNIALRPPYGAPNPTSLATMGTQINQILNANSTVDISVSVIDLTSGATENYGPDVAYEAASTGKLITAVDTLQQIEAGTMSINDTLEDDNSVGYDLKIMIVNSDDIAWQSLNDRLGESSLEDTSTSLGISGYNLETNELKTSDVAGLLQKLYKGTILDSTDRSLLMGYLKSANYRDYIVAAVPGDVTVYHKVGLLDDRIHDSAIIDNGSDPIVLVIFTNGHGTYNFPARTTAIQAITKAALAGYDIN